jgi:hypothetical protein
VGRAKRQVGNHSLAVLLGLGANALFGLWWADLVVALLVAIVVIQAGVRAWRGPACDDDFAPSGAIVS